MPTSSVDVDTSHVHIYMYMYLAWANVRERDPFDIPRGRGYQGYE